MKTKVLAGFLAVSAISAAGGWFASEISNADNLQPGRSILAAWQSQLTVMTNAQGDLRDHDDALVSGAQSLSALSIGLATHYDQLSADEKREIQRFLPRAKAIPGPASERDYQAVLGCIESAGTGSISEDCVTKALAET